MDDAMSARIIRRGERFAQLPEGVLALATRVPPRAIVLWAWLDRFAGENSGAYPGQKRLAGMIGCSVRQVRTLLVELEEAGALVIHDRPGYTSIMELVNPEPAADYTSRQTPEEEFRGTPEEKCLPPRKKSSDEPEPLNQSQLNESQSLAAAAAIRPRDPIWDVLAAGFGDPATSSERGKRNRAVKELRDAGATPDQIIRRADAWPHHFPGATLTDTALVKHWTQLGRPVMRRNPEADDRWQRLHGRQQLAQPLPAGLELEASV